MGFLARTVGLVGLISAFGVAGRISQHFLDGDLIGTRKRHPARRGSTSIAGVNRWTGKPHEHAREIARRQRQAGKVGA